MGFVGCLSGMMQGYRERIGMEIVTVSCLSALCVSLCSVNPDGKIEAVVLVNFVAAA
jgi:hypothetical protein